MSVTPTQPPPPPELLRLRVATSYYLDLLRDVESAVEQMAEANALRDPRYRTLLESLRAGNAPAIARDVARLLAK